MNVHVSNDETAVLVLDWLQSVGLVSTMRALERETGMVVDRYGPDLIWLRNLVLDGEFETALTMVRPLESRAPGDEAQATLALLRQQFLEAVNDRRSEADVAAIVSLLESLEPLTTKTEFNRLCYLLSLSEVTDADEWAEWTPMKGRLACFESLLPLVGGIFYPSPRGGAMALDGERLRTLLQQSIAYQVSVYMADKPGGGPPPSHLSHSLFSDFDPDTASVRLDDVVARLDVAGLAAVPPRNTAFAHVAGGGAVGGTVREPVDQAPLGSARRNATASLVAARPGSRGSRVKKTPRQGPGVAQSTIGLPHSTAEFVDFAASGAAAPSAPQWGPGEREEAALDLSWQPEPGRALERPSTASGIRTGGGGRGGGNGLSLDPVSGLDALMPMGGGVDRDAPFSEAEVDALLRGDGRFRASSGSATPSPPRGPGGRSGEPDRGGVGVRRDDLGQSGGLLPSSPVYRSSPSWSDSSPSPPRATRNEPQQRSRPQTSDGRRRTPPLSGRGGVGGGAPGSVGDESPRWEGGGDAGSPVLGLRHSRSPPDQHRPRTAPSAPMSPSQVSAWTADILRSAEGIQASVRQSLPDLNPTTGVGTENRRKVPVVGKAPSVVAGLPVSVPQVEAALRDPLGRRSNRPPSAGRYANVSASASPPNRPQNRSPEPSASPPERDRGDADLKPHRAATTGAPASAADADRVRPPPPYVDDRPPVPDESPVPPRSSSAPVPTTPPYGGDVFVASPLRSTAGASEVSLSATPSPAQLRRSDAGLDLDYYCAGLLEDGQAVRAIGFDTFGERFSVGTNSKRLLVGRVPAALSVARASPAKETVDGPPPPVALGDHLDYVWEKHHLGSVYCLAWSPQDTLLATGSNSKQIKIISFEAGARRATDMASVVLSGHSGTVRDLAFLPSPGGGGAAGLLSGGAGDNALLLWDIPTATPVAAFQGHTAPVFSVEVGESGALAVTGSADATVRLWDLRTSKCVRSMEAGSAAVSSVHICPASLSIASGHADGVCRVWDLATGSRVGVYDYHSDDCRTVRFSPDGRFILTGSYDGSLGLIARNANTHRVIASHDGKVIAARWHPVLRHTFMSSSADKTVRLWKARGASGSPSRDVI